jgi:hypothetical protein
VNSYRAVETRIRIHKINTIKSEDKQDFRNLDNTKQEKEIQELLQQHVGDPKAGTINIFKPKTGAKEFEALALITFKTTTLKYAFERAFAAWKRDKPTKNEKLTISRAPPATAPGDDKTQKKTIGYQEGDNTTLPQCPQESPQRKPHKYHSTKRTN